MPDKTRGRLPSRPDSRPQDAPPSAYNVAPTVARSADLASITAYEDRQRRYAAEMARHRRASERELEEAFDCRHDGLAAKRRFDDALALHALLFAGGSKCRVLAELTQAERRLQRARGGTG